MTNDVFATKCINIAEHVKTLYVNGGWGQPLTDANKKYFIDHYSFNRSVRYGKNRADVINAASSDTFAFDCNCYIKSLLDGFSADLSKPYGGATYCKPCKDYTIKDMLGKECTEVSTNMNNLLIGEYLSYADYSHCGIYVGVIDGKRMVAECTYRWKDGVQLVDMDCAERKGLWKYHGKLWHFMDYKFKEASLPAIIETKPVDNTDTVKELKQCIAIMSDALATMASMIDKL